MTAQRSDPRYPYPANDVPLQLLWGSVVRQRDVVIFRGQHTSSLTIVIETPSPASESARVAREAN